MKLMKSIGDINENCLILKKINNLDQNFKKLFSTNNSIIYKKCKNLRINFDNTITKITFIKCKYIQVELSKIINGIEIVNCEDIKIIIKPNCLIYNVIIEKSNNIELKINSTDDIFFDIDDNNCLKINKN